MTRSEEADQLFRPSGFWLRVVPQVGIVNTIMLAAIAYPLRDQVSFGSGAPVLAMLSLVITLSTLFRYRRAAQNHRELKSRFGMDYAALIDEGKIIITASSVILSGAPESLARQYFPIDDLR